MKVLARIIIIYILFVQPIHAQTQQYIFNNLGEKDGLRNNIIFSFLKDSHGILWVGTQNGLNRFDGSHFYTFRKTREPNSLPNNNIQSLCEDQHGNIWGGTSNGVFCFQPSSSTFKVYYASPECHDNIFTNISCSNQGEIFATTTTALVKLNVKKSEFELVTYFTDQKDAVYNFSISKNRMLYDGKLNNFWIGTQGGLILYNNNSHKTYGSFNSASNALFSRRNVTALAKSPAGYFLFCDNNSRAIVCFDPLTQQEIRRIPYQIQSQDADGATILADAENHLWFSNWAFEILYFDLSRNSIEKVENKEGSNSGVASGFFWAAQEDENGTIWLGTTNGISMCNPGKNIYKACNLPGKIASLKTSPVAIVEEDPADKTWWLLTEDRTLVHYLPATQNNEVYSLKDAVKNRQQKDIGTVKKLVFVNNRVILLSSNGAWHAAPGSKKLLPFNFLPREYEGFIIADMMKADSLYYITDRNQLLIWNEAVKKGTWVNFPQAIDSKQKNGIINLLWKPGHRVYWSTHINDIGTTANNGQASVIRLIKNDTAEAGGVFFASDMDNDGNVWVANKGVGLYRYSPLNGQVRYWTEMDGLTDNHLHSIKTDDQGNVWALYFNKASVFNPKDNSFVNFTIPYSENKINYFNHLTKRSDGVIMGSVANDVFEFSPENLHIKPQAKTPGLSVINISGKDYFIGDERNIFLNTDENSIHFKFGLLTDATLYPHDFEYMLEGSDKNWVEASVSNEANYNNLPPGNYRFRLKARGKNNEWQSLEKTIGITIKTPFYKSVFFIAAMVVLLIILLFWLYRYRMRQQQQLFSLKGKTQLLEKEKTMVMYESLKQQLNPHFLFNSLTSLSGLIETDQQLAGSFLEQMSGIYRYILKNGDKETVTIKEENEFVQLYISLQQTRFKKGLQVNINVPEEMQHYRIAPVTLQNLIENAIKHNIIDAESPLVIEIFTEGEYLLVRNNLQKKNMVETSNKKGLAQFETLYSYLSKKPIVIEESLHHFTVKIPLI